MLSNQIEKIEAVVKSFMNKNRVFKMEFIMIFLELCIKYYIHINLKNN